MVSLGLTIHGLCSRQPQLAWAQVQNRSRQGAPCGRRRREGGVAHLDADVLEAEAGAVREGAGVLRDGGQLSNIF